MGAPLCSAFFGLLPFGASQSRPARPPAPDVETTSNSTPQSWKAATAPAISAMLGAPPPSTSAVRARCSQRSALSAVFALRFSLYLLRWRGAEATGSGAGVAFVLFMAILPSKLVRHVPGDVAAQSITDAEQSRRGATQDGDPLLVIQPRGVEHEVDLRAGPRERVVSSDHDLARTAFRNQVAQRLGREHDGVEEELAVLEIRGRLLLGQRADPVGERPDHCIRPVGVGRQEAAAMRGADLQPGKAVERAFEDQVRQSDG